MCSVASTVTPGCAATRARPDARPPPAGTVVEAPRLSAWPEGLPDPIKHDDDSVTMPPELSLATGLRLAECEDLEVDAAEAIIEQVTRDDVRINEALEVCSADCDRWVTVVETEAEGWAWWEVGLVAGGAFVFGGFVGLLGGIMAAQAQ